MTAAPAADLAVVIVNFNTGEWLARCLRSLEAARGDLATDVIVIDNASRDGSADVADGVAGVRLVRNDTNRYLSPAWNQGARLTDAPYLLFLNPDTEWFAGTLADLVRVARDDPTAGIVGPMLRDPDGTVYASGRRFPGLVDGLGHAFVSLVRRDNAFSRRYRMDDWDRATPRAVDWVSGAAMLMPRSGVRRRRRLRRAVPVLRGGVGHRLASGRRGLARRVHAGGGGAPRGRRLHRRRSAAPPPRRDALREPVSLLRDPSSCRVASRNLAAGVAGAPGARRARVGDREGGATMKAVVLVGGSAHGSGR